MTRWLLYHEVDGKQAKGPTLTTPAVHKHGPLLLPGLLDESNYCINNALIDDSLDVIFGPIKSEEAHALDRGVILRVPSRAIDDMGDLVECEPLDILRGEVSTCAMTSSPMKMQSVTLVGIESYYCPTGT